MGTDQNRAPIPVSLSPPLRSLQQHQRNYQARLDPLPPSMSEAPTPARTPAFTSGKSGEEKTVSPDPVLTPPCSSTDERSGVSTHIFSGGRDSGWEEEGERGKKTLHSSRYIEMRHKRDHVRRRKRSQRNRRFMSRLNSTRLNSDSDTNAAQPTRNLSTSPLTRCNSCHANQKEGPGPRVTMMGRVRRRKGARDRSVVIYSHGTA
jgi:hypothetical protein